MLKKYGVRLKDQEDFCKTWSFILGLNFDLQVKLQRQESQKSFSHGRAAARRRSGKTGSAG